MVAKKSLCALLLLTTLGGSLLAQTNAAAQRTINRTLTSNETPAIVEQALPAIVRIEGVDIGGSAWAATGFLVDPTGVIVTSLHAVAPLKTVAVKLSNGDTYDKVVVRGFDERRDLAVLKISGHALPALSLGNSDSAKVGQRVILIGVVEGSVTSGVVSEIRASQEGFRSILTDAAGTPGNSGGPLIDESGRAIGVSTSKTSGGNLNPVVPANYVRGLLDDAAALSFDDLRGLLHAPASATPPVTSTAPVVAKGPQQNPDGPTSITIGLAGGIGKTEEYYQRTDGPYDKVNYDGWEARGLGPAVEIRSPLSPRITLLVGAGHQFGWSKERETVLLSNGTNQVPVRLTTSSGVTNASISLRFFFGE